MKKDTRLVSLLLCLLLLTALLCGCGSAAKSVPVAELVDAVTSAAGLGELADPGESYVRGYLKKSADELGEYAIRMNVTGTNIDEFGIFKAGKLTVKELEETVKGYLQTRQDGWMDEYMPEEKPKLLSAEVKTVGDCVMYAILSDADRTAAFDAFSSALK